MYFHYLYDDFIYLLNPPIPLILFLLVLILFSLLFLEDSSNLLQFLAKGSNLLTAVVPVLCRFSSILKTNSVSSQNLAGCIYTI